MSGRPDYYERISRVVTLLVFTVGVFVAVAAPLLAVSYANLPFPGFFTDPLLVVNNMSGTDWTARQQGIGRPEHVLRVGGVNVVDQADFRAVISAREVGSDVSLFTEFPDGSFRLYPAIRLQAFPTVDLIRYFWLPYLIGLSYLVIAVWIYLVSGRTRPGRSLAFFSGSTAVVCMLIFDFTTTQALFVLWLVGFAQTGGSLLSLTMRFPTEWRTIGRHPWLLGIPYGISLALAVWNIRLAMRSESPWEYRGAINGLYLYTAISVIIFLATMLYLGTRSSSLTVRRQARIVLVGSTIAFLPVTAWFLIPYVGPDLPFNSALYLPTLVLFPLAVATAILRYRLWEIDALVNKAIVYGVLTAILAGFFSAGSSVLQKLFVAFTGERSDAALVLTSFIIAAAFVPIRTRVQQFVDRQFKEPEDNTERLRELGQEAENFVSLSEPRRLTRRLLEAAADCLGAESAALVFSDGVGEERLQAVGSWRGQIAASVPLDCGGRRYGFLFLGPRASGEPYNLADFQILSQVTGQVAHVIRLHEIASFPPEHPVSVPAD